MAFRSPEGKRQPSPFSDTQAAPGPAGIAAQEPVTTGRYTCPGIPARSHIPQICTGMGTVCVKALRAAA